jgi:flagellin
VPGLVLQVGANNDTADRMTLIEVNSMTAESLGLVAAAGTTGSTYSVANNVKTQQGAQDALDILDNAIAQVSTQRGKLGAFQNRLEHTITNLGVAAENQAAANSRIRDADVAAEVTEMVRTQILSQSAMAILAQANAAPQALLSLFR